MAGRPFPTNPYYLESIRGLRRLHELAIAGQSQSPEADAVRDGLERPWGFLSEAEKARIDGLSEDLYSISDAPHPIEPLNPQAQRKLIEAIRAQESGDWDRALDIFRRWGRFMDAPSLSYFRGAVWYGAGDPATAALFFNHAARLNPGDDVSRVMYLDCLGKTDPDEALRRSRSILEANDRDHPYVVAKAAEILFNSTRDLIPPDAVPIWRSLVVVLEQTLQRLPGEGPDRPSNFELIYLHLIFCLARCFKSLDDGQSALRYYNLGLAADPENVNFLVARGILRYGSDPDAHRDFERAIRRNRDFIVPYFFLSHHHLFHNRYEECRRMCETALDLSGPDVLLALLKEWLAISRAELGSPPESIRAAFEEARRLAPDDEEIRRNSEIFEEAAARSVGSGPYAWIKTQIRLIRALGAAEFSPTDDLLKPAA